MLEALSASDFHLDGMDKHFTNATERQMLEIDKIYQYALKNGIKHVFIPGDICDKPSMSNTAWVALIGHLFKYDGLIHTYYINGNHDKSDVETTACDFLEVLATNGVFKTFHIALQPEQLVVDGINVNLCSWPCKQSMTEKKGAVNFVHVTYNGAVGDTGRKLKAEDEFLAHKNDYTVSGHIHQYQHLKSRRAVYNGNPYQKNFGEALPKGFVHFKARYRKNEVEFKHRFVDNVPNFQLVHLHIKDASDFDKLSTRDSVRYKLSVNSDVLIPSDIRIQYPNITGGIFNADTKKKADGSIDDLPEEGAAKAIVSVSPTKHLKTYLENQGFSKKEIKAMRSIAKEARQHIGC
jgi:DNA repair exonuclease SbcCD nuclease subunit